MGLGAVAAAVLTVGLLGDRVSTAIASLMLAVAFLPNIRRPSDKQAPGRSRERGEDLAETPRRPLAPGAAGEDLADFPGSA